jgi:hypothetical protein
MKTKEYLDRLHKLSEILEDSEFLLKTEQFPIYNLQTEPYPDEFPILFQPAHLPSIPAKQKILDPVGQVLAVDHYLSRNFSCKLCPDRERGIRAFLRRGRKKLLVLHYTGDSGLGGHTATIKRSNRIVFKSSQIEDFFEELIQETFGFSHEEFFYQEYPGCHFSKKLTQGDWKKRATACDFHVLETVQTESIKGILVLGSAAVLRWTKEFCIENQGKVMAWKFANGEKLPFLITRSPEALVHARENIPEKYEPLRLEMKSHLTNLSKITGGWD